MSESSIEKDVKALREALKLLDSGVLGFEGGPSYLESECSPDRIKRVLDALEEQTAATACSEAAYLEAAKLIEEMDARLARAVELLRKHNDVGDSIDYWWEIDAFLKEQPEEPSDFCATCGADRTKAEP